MKGVSRGSRKSVLLELSVCAKRLTVSETRSLFERAAGNLRRSRSRTRGLSLGEEDGAVMLHVTASRLKKEIRLHSARLPSLEKG